MLRILFTLCLVLPASLLAAPVHDDKASGVPLRNRVTVPYREDREGRPLIEALLSGKRRGTFLFDTGTNGNLISPRTARELGLTSRPAMLKDGSPARFADGTIYRTVTVPSLGLGELVYPEERFALFPNERFGKVIGANLDGIIGVLTVCESAVLLDFERKTLTVWYPASLTPTERAQAGLDGAVAIPMVEQSLRFQYAVRVRLNGEYAEELLVDTGAPQTSISQRAATRLNLPLLGPPRTLRLLFREEEIQLARLKSLQIGKHTVENLEVQVPVRDGGGSKSILGLDVLSRFRVLIEFPEEKLYLAPRAAAK